jgi:hypothetical protein
LYGFRRITQGPDAGAYYHELFLKGRPTLSQRMIRQKVKGTGHKQPADVKTEPNFYLMPPIVEMDTNTFMTPIPHETINSKTQVTGRPLIPLLTCESPHATSTKYKKRQGKKKGELSIPFPPYRTNDDVYTSIVHGRRIESDIATNEMTTTKLKKPFSPDNVEASPGMQNAAYLLSGIAASLRIKDDNTRLSIPIDDEKLICNLEQFDDATESSGLLSTATDISSYGNNFYESFHPRLSTSDFSKQFEDN